MSYTHHSPAFDPSSTPTDEARNGDLTTSRLTLYQMAEALVSATPLADTVRSEIAHMALGALPPRMKAIALSGTTRSATCDAGPGWLANWSAQQPYVLMAVPGPRAEKLLPRLIGDRTAAIGPALPPAQAHLSLHWARTLLEIRPSGDIYGGRQYGVEDYLTSILLLRDQGLVELMVRSRLGPLYGLTPVKQERIAETLLAWFECDGVDEAADQLKVHPQTVRYRVRRAKEIFGDDLSVPARRLEIYLALKILYLTDRPADRRRGLPLWARSGET